MKRYFPALILFAVILIHGSLIGLTDDEAYYWILAQKPALGYAYHPPAVALCIAFAQWLFGGIFGHHSALLVRLPAAFCAAAIVALGTRWMGRSGTLPGVRGPLALISLVGLFSLSWMMVPDLPLFLGWTLAFVAAWEICFTREKNTGPRIFSEWSYLLLSLGLGIAILSKYSGVLAGVSALISILLWAPRERRLRGVTAVLVGGVLAAIPILYWNATHQWASILYQIKDRHGEAHLSLIRYLRFWAIELVLAGPPLVVFAFMMVRRWLRREALAIESYALIWALPGALVFFLQPLWADFKPHWALIVWWPLVLAFGWNWAHGGISKLGRWQAAYGLGVGALVLVSCHLPLGSGLMAHLYSTSMDPRLDVTNDLYGWADLRVQIEKQFGAAGLKRAIIGGRYQTASQAAFSMGEGARVTLLPRDPKSLDEWPDLAVSIGQGPEWPRLSEAILFVGDNRYDAAPEFPGARCQKVLDYQKIRFGFPAKTILVWSCEPSPTL